MGICLNFYKTESETMKVMSSLEQQNARPSLEKNTRPIGAASRLLDQWMSLLH